MMISWSQLANIDRFSASAFLLLQVLVFLHGKLWHICFLDFAKNFRMVAFYNKQLKKRIIIWESRAKKLKFHVTWQVVLNTKCEAPKMLSRVRYRKRNRVWYGAFNGWNVIARP